MKFKLFILVVLFQFGQNNLLSQYYLDVPLIGQEHAQSCWAASMEMIHKFHNVSSSINQCTILNKYLWFKPGATLIDCTTFSCNATPYTADLRIPFCRREKKVFPHYFDLVNSNFGYHSMEDLEVLQFDWPKIVNEINVCRPFAMFLTKIDLIDNSVYNHVVVAKGYVQYGNENYILVNDPQNTSRAPGCVGCEFLIPFKAYNDNITELNSCLQIARSIFPKNIPECTNCTKLLAVSSNNLISAITTNAQNQLLPGINKYVFTDLDINNLLAVRNSNNGRAVYIRQPFTITDVSKTNTKNLFALVAVQSTPQIVIIFEASNQENKIKQISTADCTAFQESIRLSFLNDTLQRTFSFGQYELVEVIPGFQQFYRVKINNVSYMSPVKDYPNSSFKVSKLYRENIVFAELNKLYPPQKTKDQAVPQKKCFIFNWFGKKRRVN